MSVYQQTGELDEKLNLDPIPLDVEHLWYWFWDLSNQRQVAMGTSPLSYEEIESWSKLTGNQLSPWEVETLIEMDRAYVSAISEEIDKEFPRR